MKKKSKQKLTLNSETLRQLSATETDEAAGGTVISTRTTNGHISGRGMCRPGGVLEPTRACW